MDDAHAAARQYAELGYGVVPIAPGTKYPKGLEHWQELATSKLEDIDRWYTGPFAGYGVGIATGLKWNLVVIDIDVTKGGGESLAKLVEEIPLPNTVTTVTGTNGRHLYYATTVAVPNSASGSLGPGIDVRGEGGQVVAPPTIHPNGRPYGWRVGHSVTDLEPAMIPEALLERLLQPHVGNGAGVLATVTPIASHGERPGVRFERESSWEELLLPDGFHIGSRRDGHGGLPVTRPGKDPRDGISATLGYEGNDVLHVFTTSVPWLAAEESYNRFAYLVARTTGNPHPSREDFAQVAQSLSQGYRQAPAPASPTEAAPGLQEDTSLYRELRIDLGALLDLEISEDDWLIEPFIARGRGHALYATAKDGKSFVALQAILAACMGQASWTEAPKEPVTVLYLDYEMLQADLRDRLVDDWGFTREADFSRLHYISAAGLGRDLDNAAGGRRLVAAALEIGAQLVVIDTLGRAVAGEENAADTIRDFYTCTGGLLKAHGIAMLRIDHAGKDREKGQRGTSAKNDDVDVVWGLRRTDSGAELRQMFSRMPWVPPAVLLKFHQEPDGRRFHRRDTGKMTWPAGMHAVLEALEEAGIGPEVAYRKLRGMGVSGSTDALRSAQKFRRMRLDGDPRSII